MNVLNQKLLRLPFLNNFFSNASGQTLTDKQICLEIMHIFEHDLGRSKLSGLHFCVQNQIVTVQGSLKNRYDHALVMQLLQQIEKLQGVVDNIYLTGSLG